MNKLTPRGIVLSLVLLTLGAVICITLNLPELKTNMICQGVLIVLASILSFYILMQFIRNVRNDLKAQQHTKQRLPSAECWKIIVAGWFSLKAAPEQRELIRRFIITLFTKIEISHKYYNPDELRKDIYEYIQSPLDILIEYISPIADPEQINDYRSEDFKLAFEEFRLWIKDISD